MKKIKNTLSVLLVMTIIIALAACGGGSDSGTAATDAPEPAATEASNASPAPSDEIDDAEETDSAGDTEEGDVLVMGTNAEFPPYEFYEGDEIVGIDAEIAEAIAEKLGKELVIEDMKFDAVLMAMQTGKIDMALAGMTVTEDRLENMDFSNSYATGIQSIIVPEGSDIKSPDDLTDKKIGVQSATTGDIYATDDYGDEFVERYNKGADAILALKKGAIDCVVIDNEPAKVFAEENPELQILDTEYLIEEYAVAVEKGNTELLEKINEALEELTADGTLESIIDKYIKAD